MPLIFGCGTSFGNAEAVAATVAPSAVAVTGAKAEKPSAFACTRTDAPATEPTAFTARTRPSVASASATVPSAADVRVSRR